MSSSKRFDCLFRLDAGAPMGMGHLMRSLVLIKALKKRGLRHIAILTRTPGVVRKSVPKSVSVITVRGDEVNCWREHFSKQPPQLAVIDSYRVTSRVLEKLSAFLPKLALFDDYKHLKHYPVDAIINGNIHAKKIKYSKLKKTRLFLGSDYLCISDAIKPKRRKLRSKLRLFVTLGGVPKKPHLHKIGQFLAPFKQALRVDMAGGLTHNSSLFKDRSYIVCVPFNRARSVMAQADIAISTASVTSYELARLGVPSLVTVTADNQLPGAREMHRVKMAHYLGRIEKMSKKSFQSLLQKWLASPKLRNQYAKRAQKKVDGKGADRLARELIRLGRS